MSKAFVYQLVFSILAMILTTSNSYAQRNPVYSPIPITTNQINDKLTDKDIPTVEGGFARDYVITLEANDYIAIELNSDNFDTILTLMNSRGKQVAENDDAPDGSTNSIIFTQIKQGGKYIIRVRAFGEASGGDFSLRVLKLDPKK